MQETAKNALALLERVTLKGNEVQAYFEVNQMLGKIANGELVVSEPQKGKKNE